MKNSKYLLVLVILLLSCCNRPFKVTTYVLSQNFGPILKFENYSQEEIEKMKIYLMRGTKIIDTCFVLDLSQYDNHEMEFLTHLRFKSPNDSIVKSDTILFTIAEDIYKIYNIRYVAVKRGFFDMGSPYFKGYDIKDADGTVHSQGVYSLFRKKNNL